jgi:hypothetical protein
MLHCSNGSFVRIGGGLYLANGLYFGPTYTSSPMTYIFAGLMNFNTLILTNEKWFNDYFGSQEISLKFHPRVYFISGV